MKEENRRGEGIARSTQVKEATSSGIVIVSSNLFQYQLRTVNVAVTGFNRKERKNYIQRVVI